MFTAGQESRLLKWLPKIGLSKDKALNDAGLPEDASVVLEIGFGNGDFLVHLAETHPDWYLLGVEIYLPGVAKAVGRLEDAGLIERCRIFAITGAICASVSNRRRTTRRCVYQSS